MTSWENEKTYCENRANELREAMSNAIEYGHNNEFNRLYDKSGRYLSRKEQKEFMRLYIASIRKEETGCYMAQ